MVNAGKGIANLNCFDGFLAERNGEEQVNYTICNADRQEKLRTWRNSGEFVQVRKKILQNDYLITIFFRADRLSCEKILLTLPCKDNSIISFTSQLTIYKLGFF